VIFKNAIFHDSLLEYQRPENVNLNFLIIIIIAIIQEKRLRWYVYVMRMEEGHVAERVLGMVVKRKRRREKPTEEMDGLCK